jgi:predicted GTPase
VAGEGELFNFHCQVNRAVAIPPPPPREGIPAPPVEPAARQAAIDAAHTALGIAANDRAVGVVGMTGSGKSALVNALRRVADTAPDAAKEGIVETTTHGAPYPWVVQGQRTGQRLVLWDLPGGGTALFDDHLYFTQQKLYAFHRLLLVTSGRYKDGEDKIVQQALAWQIPFAVVQTKADIAIVSEVDMAEGRGADVHNSAVLPAITEETISRLRATSTPSRVTPHSPSSW